MKKLLFLLFIFGALAVAGCIAPEVSHQISMCNGIYYKYTTVNGTVETDQQAFDILKSGMTYDTQNNSVWVEDQIPSDTTLDEALSGDRPLLRKDQEIRLDTGETISPVWIIGYGKNKALDTNGNIYLCEGIKP